jgi:NADP-dependent 3-hydroxy acid dehydrogenase YdfG
MRAVAGKNAPAAEALRALAQRERLALQIVEIDVTDDASVERAIAEIIETIGRLDVVVNNAGVSYSGPLEAFTLEQIRQQFETNVFSVLRVNSAVLPQMREQGSGLLLQIGSIAGRLAFPFWACMERRSLPWRDSPSRIDMNWRPLASTPPL